MTSFGSLHHTLQASALWPSVKLIQVSLKYAR